MDCVDNCVEVRMFMCLIFVREGFSNDVYVRKRELRFTEKYN